MPACHLSKAVTAREGLTLHDVSYLDQEHERSVLHRASLTEIVVPYGDPSPTHFRKNAFDVGEYGMGMCANSLVLGCDCLGEIRYMDAHFCISRGESALDRIDAKHAGLTGQAYRDAIAKDVFKPQDAARAGMSSGLALYKGTQEAWTRLFSVV